MRLCLTSLGYDISFNPPFVAPSLRCTASSSDEGHVIHGVHVIDCILEIRVDASYTLHHVRAGKASLAIFIFAIEVFFFISHS
jgi:hypothetical protein